MGFGRLVVVAVHGETLMRIAILSLGLLAAVGTVRGEEEKIAVKSLPKAVTAAVKAKFPEAKITEASKEEEDHKVIYEVEIKDDDSKASLAVSAKGKILEIEKPISVEKLPKSVQKTLAAKYSKAKVKSAEEVLKFEDEDDDDDDDKPGKKDDDDDDDKPKKTYEVVLSSEGKGSFEVKFTAAGKVIEEEDDEDDKPAKKEKDDDDKPRAKKEKDKD